MLSKIYDFVSAGKKKCYDDLPDIKKGVIQGYIGLKKAAIVIVDIGSLLFDKYKK